MINLCVRKRESFRHEPFGICVRMLPQRIVLAWKVSCRTGPPLHVFLDHKENQFRIFGLFLVIRAVTSS